MNTGLLNSFASMAKGCLNITDVIKTTFTKFADEAPTDDQVLAGISEVVFTVILNKDARQVLSFYLIQVYANQLFISDPTSEFGTCMRLARREVDELLSFTVLNHIVKYVWEHRDQFLDLWTRFAEDMEAYPQSTTHGSLQRVIVDMVQLLEAA